MSKFNDSITTVKDILKELLTAENAETVTKIDKELDTMTAEHNDALSRESALKDSYIKVVKEFSFKTPSDDADPVAEPKTLDDILAAEAGKISAENKK